MQKNNHTIIFIPGFKGSTLIDQRGLLIWPNFIKAQFDHTINLGNHLPNINIENSNIYQPEEIVKSVTILPGILKHQIYAPFINALKRHSSSPNIIWFHYDWRQDLMTTVNRLMTLNIIIIKL